MYMAVAIRSFQF